MAVAFVDDAEVVNGTAGTDITVSRPPGAANGHLLIAFAAAVGNPTISTPAGWTLIGTQDASTNVRLAAFWKVASGEPASWTWTLGTSQRNWGWVGAYSGVNTSLPIHASRGTADTTAGTGFTSTPVIELTSGGVGVSAVAAVRTASGAAATWTGSGQNERADLSTNGGAGTDIAGMAQDSAYTSLPPASYGPTWTASLSQTAGAMWALTLTPAFIGYNGGELAPIVEAAFGADPDSDPATWTWTNITADAVDVGTQLVITAGRDDRGSIDEELASTKLTLTLIDETGKYMPDNPNGLHYPNIVEDVPIRVRMPYGYVTPSTRATVLVDRWAPSWDDSGALSFVAVTASGRLQRVRTTGTPAKSALHRRILGLSAGGITPHAYYPCEDGSGATRVASALPGHQPLQVSGAVSFGSANDLAGSDPLPTIGDGAVLAGTLGPGYTATAQWAVTVALKLPETPVATASRLMLVVCTGTAREWSLWMVPGSPDTLNIRADIFGTSLLDDAIGIVEADHYGKWRLYTILVTQNGADIDWEAWSHGTDSGVGNTGTLAGRTIGAARTVRLVAFSALAGMGAGHIALYTDPAFTSVDLSFNAFAALDGNAGDTPFSRFQRLCTEEGFPYDSDWDPVETEILMGPQPSGSLGTLLQQPADTDHGFIHDARPDGELYFATRWPRYNREPALILDGSLRQIPASLRPTADGQSKITDSTVTRDGGSSARYVANNVRGNRPDAKTLSLETDQHLSEIAGWRVNLGNASPLRYTQVPLNLRGSPELAEAWMNCRIGDRVKAINLPATHGPTEADGILVGYREEISADWWMVYMNLAPARPYDVPVMESGDDKTWRMETGGAEIASAATSSATLLLVATTGDALWTTAGANYPADFDINGERVTVSSVGSGIRDTFTRTVADGWSTSDSGQTWTNSGGAAADYDVNGTKGLHTHPSANVIHHSSVSIGTSDHRVRAYINLGTGTLAGAGATGFVLARMTDTSNWYAARIGYATSGAVTLQIAKMVGGAGALVGSGSWSLGTHANYAAVQFIVQIDVRGSTLSASAWDATAAESTTWQVIETDTDLTTGTLVGVASRRDTGNTDANLIAAWDNFAVLNPQLITVTRGVAGGATAKAHAVGAPVKLWRARGLAL
jgi:hypothetical protein